MNKKRRLKIKPILILIFIIIIIFALIINLNNSKKENKPEKKEEIKIVKNKFEDEKYYIESNLERYESYYNSNPDLSITEVVKRINCNLDKTFYVDTNPSDDYGIFTLVNKFYYLKEDFVPNNLEVINGKYARDEARLVDVASSAFKKMVDDAYKEGLTIKITTGYRSYSFQSTLYNNYVNADGVKEADTYSARPGYSEHQLGYSADVTNKDLVSFNNFKNTEEYKWLQNNAYKYGFIIRYTEENQYITGYMAESWHYRYVGVDAAKIIYDNNLTYEEYYAYYVKK